jgi:hypothetical protein
MGRIVIIMLHAGHHGPFAHFPPTIHVHVHVHVPGTGMVARDPHKSAASAGCCLPASCSSLHQPPCRFRRRHFNTLHLHACVCDFGSDKALERARLLYARRNGPYVYARYVSARALSVPWCCGVLWCGVLCGAVCVPMNVLVPQRVPFGMCAPM